MDEITFLEKVILSLGDSAPYLLFLFMLIRWVWPDVKELLSQYMTTRQDLHQNASAQFDSLVAEVSGLVRTSNIILAGLAGREMSDRVAALMKQVEQPPSPKSAATGEASPPADTPKVVQS